MAATVVQKVRNHEIDPGYLNVMNLRMNFLADPRIEEPRRGGARPHSRRLAVGHSGKANT